MAKQARDGGSIESGFDFSKFLDLDDDDLIVDSTADDPDYQTIPHSRDEVVTGALHLELDGPLEGYMKAGKVSWSDKRALKKLAAENRELEAVLIDTDEALLERTVSYHGLVSGILREKNGFSSYALDDSDPYDSQSKGSDSKPLGSAEARAQSSEIFKEIEDLEAHRSELNEKRTAALVEIREIAAKQENGGWEPLEGVLEDKLEAIGRIQPITKVQFSEEDEALFEQGVDDLTGYIEGNFDPLADEDEYDEDHSRDSVEEIPLSSDGHSDEEILAMEENASNDSDDQSFTELFTDGRDEIEEPLDESEEVHRGEEFSSEETPDELEAALGEGYEPVAEEDSAEVDSLEEHDYLGDYPHAELSADAEETTDAASEDSPAAGTEDEYTLEDDLSASDPGTDEHFEDAESLPEAGSSDAEDGIADPSADVFAAEGAEEQAPDELAADVVSELDVPDDEDEHSDEEIAVDSFEETATEEVAEEPEAVEENFGSLSDSEDEEISSSYADFSEYSTEHITVKTVIFDELKAKYGISFEGVPGLEN